jgi:hypothetical protein
MATPAFPSWITFWPLQASYQEQVDTNQAASQPATGAPTLRRRSLLAQRLITFTLPLSSLEFEALKTFYRTTLKDGTLQFTMPHPRTGVGATWAWQVDNPPKVNQTYGLTFEIILTLRLIAGGVTTGAGHPVARAMVASETSGAALDFGLVTSTTLSLYDDFGIIGMPLDAIAPDLGAGP